MRKGKDPDPDPYLWQMDPDPQHWVKIVRLHAALFDIYYFCYTELTAVGLAVIYVLTELDDKDDVILMQEAAW